ncbi:hypothetical protein [Bacillus massiliigorillae]|uniref:hypothetical protein n=1 Tax=Bacillus massiliigorillae TaxID=1243664 RepID=UPI0018A825FE|nr:hypothetical protein [Bacillus massiliigorillae]
MKADQYYSTAQTYYLAGKYKEALDEVENIYPLDRNINKANEIVNNSLNSIYKQAELEFAAQKFYDAKNDLTYIFSGYEHSNSQMKQKAKALFDKIVKEEEFQDKLSKARSAKDSKNYEETITLLNSLQKENKLDVVSNLYNDTVKELQKEAETSFNNKDYKVAKKHYKLLSAITSVPSLKSQYAKRIKLMQNEEIIQTMLGIEKDDIEKNSLFEHLMIEENETPYNKNIIQSLIDLLTPNDLDFIFDVNIKDLFKGVNRDAS